MSDMISVIIPVYNGEKTIIKTLKSVLTQTFSNIEIIIINDGSTDSTLEVISSITDIRIKILSYSNAGLAASRNRGISESTGKYISFIDADDLWTPDKLEVQLKALHQFPQAAIAYSWTDYIDVNGKILRPGKRTVANGDVFTQLLQSNILENGSNPLIISQVFDNIGGFDESLFAAEDWDMWLRLAANYKFACVEKSQILYRVSASSMSTNLRRQEVASLQVIERAFTCEKAASLQHLKKYALANIYRYLTFKSIETSQQSRYYRHDGQSFAQNVYNRLVLRITSAKYLWNCIKYDPTILRQQRTLLIAILKIAFPQLLYRFSQLLKSKNLTKEA